MNEWSVDHTTIELPPVPPVTEQKVQRRQELFKRAMKLRAEIGPIDIPTYELVREGRDDFNIRDGGEV